MKNFFKKSKFNIISEFKRRNENLILKDYIDYYPLEGEHFDYGFRSVKGKTEFYINNTMPRFKKQLSVDFPKIKKIKIEFSVFMIPK